MPVVELPVTVGVMAGIFLMLIYGGYEFLHYIFGLIPASGVLPWHDWAWWQLALSITVSLPLLIGISRDLFHPINMLCMLMLARVLPQFSESIAPLISLLSNTPLPFPSHQALPGVGPAEIMSAEVSVCQINIVATLAVYAGCTLTWRNSVRVRGEDAEGGNWGKVCVAWIVASLLLLSLFLYYRGGMISHLTALALGRFLALENMGPIVAVLKSAVVAAMIWVAVNPSVARRAVPFALLILVVISQFLIAASRGALVHAGICIGLAWMWRAGRVPWRFILVSLPLLMMAVAVLTVVRVSGRSGPEAMTGTLANTDFMGYAEGFYEETQSRVSGRGAVPVFLDGFSRSGGMLWGKTYVGSVLFFVPRFMWSGKPRGAGVLYPVLFLGTEESGTSIPIGSAMEAYWNFHIPGVVVLHYLFGLLLSFTWNGMRHRSSPFAAVFYILTVVWLNPTADAIVRWGHAMMAMAAIWMVGTALCSDRHIQRGDFVQRKGLGEGA